uniref:hypothetical protein n=1 Tax=Flavobacterium sp. TaxID=239 RepID=UPI004047167E
MKFKIKNYFTTKHTKMPAIKRKYGVSKAKSSYPPLKRRNAMRTYSGATAAKLPLSVDHQLLRQKQNIVLRYHESFVLNPGTAGLPSSYVFRSNSTYDPDVTGTGHQPRGYDQIMAMYQFIAVREAQIEVWFIPRDGAPVIVSINSNGSTQFNPTRNDMMENKTSVFATAGGISASDPSYLTLRVKPWQLAGTKISENDYKHPVGSNPVISQFFNVIGMPMETTDSGNIDCVARITFHCEVTEPITPPLS